ncbi:MAG TPA: hypothetical protein VFD43_12000 [Planctomycetota bacterium]|nr:hypothetical protein [Planctomycetota bacterium]
MSRVPSILLALALLAGLLPAHDAPGSSHFDLLVPDMPLNGAITFVSLVGPASGNEVLHTTWNLTYTAPHGGTPASDLILELTMPIEGPDAELVVTGADLGWPSATGTFSGSIDSDALNGVLAQGLFGFVVPELVILSTDGGVTGQFVDSTITLELAEHCQEDLGFGGPGALQLQVCGQTLSSGDSATLSVMGAPPFAPMLLVAGLAFGPTPFKGGTLVPVPWALALPIAASASGGLSLTVPGGGGPLAVYLQAAAADFAQPAGVAISNAVRLELLP